jgi:hypothetical protein
MKKKPIVMPKFVNEALEAIWWASREGREFVKQKAAESGKKRGAPKGSRLASQLNQGRQRPNCVAIARTRSCQGPRTRNTKGHRIPDPPQDAGA